MRIIMFLDVPSQLGDSQFGVDMLAFWKLYGGCCMRFLVAVISAFTLAFSLVGAALAQGASGSATVQNASGASVGSASFTQVADGVRVVARFQGLPPGVHGIHVHAVGRCEPADFMSAGAHFNPTGKKHGLKGSDGGHAGDLSNLTIAADGTGSIDSIARGATLGAGSAAVLGGNGTALVVHASADDEVTDPTGNSGGRIACGVLAAAALEPAQLPRTGGLPLGLIALASLTVLGLGVAFRRR